MAEPANFRAALRVRAAKRHLEGTHRSAALADTLARFGRLAPALGITRLANVTGLDCIGIPVVVACRPNSRSLAVAQGKGLDLDAARASALMEAIETYHAERVALPLRMGSYEELRYTHRTVDVARLPAGGTAGPFDPRRPFLWAPGVDALASEGETTWVPYEMVHTDWTLPLHPAAGGFVLSTNGLASGNDVVEAAVHALAEVIERDAATLVSVGGEPARSARRLDLATVDDASCRALLALYERAGVAVGVWDATSDVGVPVLTCVVADRDATDPRALYSAKGQGCHPSRSVALARALTEAAQSRLTYISGARDDATRARYVHAQSADARASTKDLLAQPARRAFHDLPTRENETPADDLSHMLDALVGAGFSSAVFVDLTRPELGVPVVRAIVPGLESDLEAGAGLPGERARAAMERAS